MKVNPKKSTYAKMYLVTPGVYEKLKKCIDEYDISELSKLDKTDEVESQSQSNNIIRNISMDEILSNSNENDANNLSTNNQTQSSSAHNISQPSVSNLPLALPQPEIHSSHISSQPVIITNPSISQPQPQTNPQLNISRRNISRSIVPLTRRQSILHHNTLLENIDEEDENETIEDFNPQFNSTKITFDGNNQHSIDSTIGDFNPQLHSTRISSDHYDNQPSLHTSTPKRSRAIPKSLYYNPKRTSSTLKTSQQPVAGSSKNKNVLFSKNIPNVHNQTNIPVNVPQLYDGNLVINPNDADISWVEQNTENNNDNNSFINSTDAEVDFTGGAVYSNNSNNTDIHQSISRDDSNPNHNSIHSQSSGFVVRRPQQSNVTFVSKPLKVKTISPKTRSQKRNACNPILNLKGCRPKVNVKYFGDNSETAIHDSSNIKYPVRCPICPHKFKTHNLFVNHIRFAHANPQDRKLAIEFMPNAQTKENNWVKLGKRNDVQAGLAPKKGRKYNRVMTVGLKRTRQTAQLDDTQNTPRRRYKPMHKFKNWNI